MREFRFMSFRKSQSLIFRESTAENRLKSLSEPMPMDEVQHTLCTFVVPRQFLALFSPVGIRKCENWLFSLLKRLCVHQRTYIYTNSKTLYGFVEMYSVVSAQLWFCMPERICVCLCAICLYTERHKWKCAFSFFRKNLFNCYDFPSFNDYFLLKSVMWWHVCLALWNCSLFYFPWRYWQHRRRANKKPYVSQCGNVWCSAVPFLPRKIDNLVCVYCTSHSDNFHLDAAINIDSRTSIWSNAPLFSVLFRGGTHTHTNSQHSFCGYTFHFHLMKAKNTHTQI